jgi:hypothetical protein
MSDYIETYAKDGTSIRIEVEAPVKSSTGFAQKLAPGDVSNEAVKDAYDQTLSTIRGYANGVIDTIQSLETLPSAASVDFSIKVDAEVGAMIAKSRDEGQFKISLSWKQDEPEKTEE